jgi:hypothetical protein
MLHGAEIVACSHINTKHINTVWAERTVVEPVGASRNQQFFKKLNMGRFIMFSVITNIYNKNTKGWHCSQSQENRRSLFFDN